MLYSINVKSAVADGTPNASRFALRQETVGAHRRAPFNRTIYSTILAVSIGSIPFWTKHYLKQRNCKGFSPIQRANVPNRDAPCQLIVAFAGASLSFLAGVEPGIAQPDQYCDDPGSIPAAETTRNLELDRFGIELTIPSNFRAMLLNNGNVKIVDPGTYELLSCMARGRKALGRGYAYTLVRSVENPNNLELRQLAEQKSRDHEKISPYTFDGKQGYLVEYWSQEAVGIPDAHAEFWLNINNVPGAVVISKSCDCSGMSESLVSLLERSSLLSSSQASTP